MRALGSFEGGEYALACHRRPWFLSRGGRLANALKVGKDGGCELTAELTTGENGDNVFERDVYRPVDCKVVLTHDGDGEVEVDVWNCIAS